MAYAHLLRKSTYFLPVYGAHFNLFLGLFVYTFEKQ